MSKEVADQVESSGSGTDEVVEIRASRRKDEWIAPCVVRMGEAYYRQKKNWVGDGERGFVTDGGGWRRESRGGM
jgi:hypothetical protein